MAKRKLQHTPGPWKWWDQDSGRPQGYDLAKLLTNTKTEQGCSIFTMYGGNGHYALGKTPEEVANAKLIAAAPDLLSACMVAAEYSNIEECDAKVIRAAIRKATKGTRRI